MLSSSWRRRDLGRDVHGGERRAAHGAGGAQPVAGLEAPHAGLDVGIVDRRLAGRRIEVARDDQALAQRHDLRALGADAQARARCARPASRRGRRCRGSARSPARWPRASAATGSASSSAARGRGRPPRSSAATRPAGACCARTAVAGVKTRASDPVRRERRESMVAGSRVGLTRMAT